MSAPTETSAGTTAIQPLTVPVTTDAALEALRTRVATTRWPDQELVKDHSQGPKLAVMQELARYWATEYDWRRCEAKLSALPHFMTEIDGLDIHVGSEHANALPVINMAGVVPADVSTALARNVLGAGGPPPSGLSAEESRPDRGPGTRLGYPRHEEASS